MRGARGLGWASRQPQRCHIVTVITAMMSHCCGYLRCHSGVHVLAGAGVNEYSTGGPRGRRRGADAGSADEGWADEGWADAGWGLADQALAVVGLADDAHHFLRVVDDPDQGELDRADVRPGEH